MKFVGDDKIDTGRTHVFEEFVRSYRTIRRKQTVLLLASYANRPYTKSPSECIGSMRANDVSKHDYLSGVTYTGDK